MKNVVKMNILEINKYLTKEQFIWKLIKTEALICLVYQLKHQKMENN